MAWYHHPSHDSLDAMLAGLGSRDSDGDGRLGLRSQTGTKEGTRWVEEPLADEVDSRFDVVVDTEFLKDLKLLLRNSNLLENQ